MSNQIISYDFHKSNIRVITSEDGVILLGSSTVQAYVRSDRLEERREVMQRWCGVVPKRRRRFAVIIFVT